MCFQDGRIVSLDLLDAVSVLLELVYRDLIAQEQFRPSSALDIQACDLVCMCLQGIQTYIDESDQFEQVSSSTLYILRSCWPAEI